MENIQYKSVSTNIVKDVDVKKGIVTGYYSSFHHIDSDTDALMPGAFTKTIAENGPQGKNRIMHLWQHNPSEPIGKPSTLKEDAFGLYFETQIAKTTRGIDTLKLYEDGIINEHSIGFNTVKKEQKSDHTAILEVKLWEGSTVTWGANEHTPVTGVKSLNPLELLSRKEAIYKALHKGTYTDETFLLLIEQLEYFDNQLKTLINPKEEITQADHSLEPMNEEKGLNEAEILQFISITKQKFI